MTKPVSDPLEGLRNLLAIAMAGNSLAWPTLENAIAAWEKERAERANLVESIHTYEQLYEKHTTEIARLRAAVERIEGEMRVSSYLQVAKWADELRAAREPNRPQEE